MPDNFKLIQITRPLDANKLTKALVANANSLVGVTVKDPIARAIFEEILGPVSTYWDLDRPFKVTKVNGKYVTQGVSTCALVCRGLLRRMNVDFPAIYKNYIFGTAISADIAWAKKNKCWQNGWKREPLDLRPNLGDILVIGEGLSTHMLTVVGWEDDLLVSVDGGQVDKTSLQCIKLVKRHWTQRGTAKVVEPYLDSRKVLGWIVSDLMPFKDTTITVPANLYY